MFILRYKKVVLCILDSAKVECIFEDLKDKSRVTTIIHHNYEEMVIPSTDGFEIKPDYFASKGHIELLLERKECSQDVEVYCHYTEVTFYRSYIKDTKMDNITPDNNCNCPFVGNCDAGTTR